MSTGWMPPAFLLDDPTWTATGTKKWVPIAAPGGGEPTPRGANDLVAGNRAIVADLIHAVETDTQPRTHVRAGRTAVEMVLACYASHKLSGPVPLPLAERTRHPLA